MSRADLTNNNRSADERTDERRTDDRYTGVDWPPGMDRLGRLALLVGLAGIVVAALLAFVVEDGAGQFYRSYLWAYMFWVGIPLGCLGILLLQHLAGGVWGLLTRRVLEAGTRLLPLMALLFIPIAVGVVSHDLYPWTEGHAGTGERPAAVDPEHGTPGVEDEAAAVEGDAHAGGEGEHDDGHAAGEHGGGGHELGPFKTVWLSIPFFLGRAAFYFVVWMFLAFLFNRWSDRQDRTGDPVLIDRFTVASGPGIVLTVLCVSLAVIDWVMSIDAHWYSTLFGLMFIVGQGLSTIAVMILAMAAFAPRRPMLGAIRPAHFNDLGNLLLAFTMLWAYLSFSQYLIVWSGNIAEETPYYFYRSRGGWQYLAGFLFLFHFFVPFTLLLGRWSKRHVRTIATVAGLVLVMRLVDLFWVIMPTFMHARRVGARPDGGVDVPSVAAGMNWTDLPVLLGIGGIWVWAFLWQIKRKPLIPPNDPRLEDLADMLHDEPHAVPHLVPHHPHASTPHIGVAHSTTTTTHGTTHGATPATGGTTGVQHG